MTTINRLTGAAYGMHFADQIALVAVPLIAALTFDASAQTIGVLVACHSVAHLLGSMPFGMIVDAVQQRSLAIISSLISAVGFLIAAISTTTGGIFLFAVAITFSGFGVVLFVLTALSILPKIVSANNLAKANASIELPRAICSFGVPLGVGLVVTDIAAVWIFCAAALAALVAFMFTLGLPNVEAERRPKKRLITQIVEGGSFVLRNEYLLSISLCAVFWNFGFSVLLVVLVPLIRNVYLFDPGAFGIALSAFGFAMIMGASLMRRNAGRISPKFIFLFGPGSSAVAMIGLLLVPPGEWELLLYACLFLLGFGPAMWLIAQNSVRQLVTHPNMLGRVNAVIQTAIYGIRPLGALVGGGIVGLFGAQTGIVFVLLAFTASFLAAWFSKLKKIENYNHLRPASVS